VLWHVRDNESRPKARRLKPTLLVIIQAVVPVPAQLVVDTFGLIRVDRALREACKEVHVDFIGPSALAKRLALPI
jgi:hypothetical protein